MYETHGRSSTRTSSSRRTSRWQVAGTVAVATALVGVGLGVAAAGENSTKAGAVPTVNCPTVGGGLPAVPAQAKAEVEQNLALLNTQISEANNRLRTSVGQGGPNFIQNAILGPLQDKRFAVINRMETAIGRNAAKPDLNAEGLSTCSLNANGAASKTESTSVNVAAGNNGNAAGGNNAGGNNAGGNNAGGNNAAGVPTVNCPAVGGSISGVPAQAKAEIERNLALLNTQISEANNRLRTSVGQGGPNFIQNAILGPLADKRFATINRMETAIGRNAAKPNLNAEGLSKCTLNANGAASKTENTAVSEATGNNGGNNAGGNNAGGNNTAAVPTVNCPSVNSPGNVPAQAQAEVASNLALLDKQIAEANNRLRTSVGQGGPNFIQNAILGPLADKRFSTINRIETAIGRNAAKPNLNAEGLSVCSLNK